MRSRQKAKYYTRGTRNQIKPYGSMEKGEGGENLLSRCAMPHCNTTLHKAVLLSKRRREGGGGGGGAEHRNQSK